MEEKRSMYFFACYFVWWVLHVFYRPLEDIETGDIPERIAAFADNVDDIAIWSSHEGLKAGKSFCENGRMISIYELNMPQEEKAISWIQFIEEFSKQLQCDEAMQHYCLYYLECSWVLKILVTFDELVHSLEVSDLLESYLEIREKFIYQREFLNNELLEISNNYINQIALHGLNMKMEKLYEYLVSDWLAVVILYSRKYSQY